MENKLQHHGIQGMRWGVRRYQNKDGTLTQAGKKRRANQADYVESHEDFIKAHTNKDVRSMSDKELRERLNRIQMEKQYKDLSPSTVNRGKKYVDKIIKTGTTIATVTTTALTIYNNWEKIGKIVDKVKKS